MKTSITSRSLKLLSLATQVGRKELAQNLKEQFKKGLDEITSGRAKTRIEQARLIVEHLSQLKGAALKAGQLLSLDASDYFPPEAVELLSKLQGQADPVDWAVLDAVVREDLGEGYQKNFAELDSRPAASASIGQVHRGRLPAEKGGIEVAVKIQYPGVASSIDSDLSILKTLAWALLNISGRKIELDELFSELSLVLKQETDYFLEAKNMSEFKERLKDRPEFVVPEPISELSSKRVLCMTWQSGLTINDWLKKNPSQADRNKIAAWVLDLYCLEFFQWGFVQTDPNFANFLIQEDPLRLVLLDFGATLRYPDDFRRSYIELLTSLSSLDRQKIVRNFMSFGLIDERESPETLDLFAEFLLLSLEPFQPAQQPFRFRNSDYAQRSRDLGLRFTGSLKFSPPPRKVIFLHRKLGGIFTLLKRLDVELDLQPYWNSMVGTEVGAPLEQMVDSTTLTTNATPTGKPKS